MPTAASSGRSKTIRPFRPGNDDSADDANVPATAPTTATAITMRTTCIRTSRSARLSDHLRDFRIEVKGAPQPSLTSSLGSCRAERLTLRGMTGARDAGESGVLTCRERTTDEQEI